MEKLADTKVTNLVKIVDDEPKEGNKAEYLEHDQEVVLVCHTPDHSPLLLAHSAVSHSLLHRVLQSLGLHPSRDLFRGISFRDLMAQYYAIKTH